MRNPEVTVRLADAVIRTLANGIETGAYEKLSGGDFSPFVSRQAAAIVDLICTLFPERIEKYLASLGGCPETDEAIERRVGVAMSDECRKLYSELEETRADCAQLRQDLAGLSIANEALRELIEKAHGTLSVARRK